MLHFKQIFLRLYGQSSKFPERSAKLMARPSVPGRSSSILFLLFCFLFALVAKAQVSSSIDSTQIKIGEEILYTITVQADTSDVVVFPEEQTFVPLEMIEAYKTDTAYADSKLRLIKKYGLTQFDSGHYTIPPQRILINNIPYFTDSLAVQVNDVVVDTTKQKMFNIKPPIEVDAPPFNWEKLLIWLLPILIVLGVAFYLFRRKKRRDAAQKILPPYEEAIVALQKLDNSQLLKENKSKEYYSSLTEIVKRYLDREVDEAALESTSEELITRLTMHKQAGNFDFSMETIRKLDEIFKRADLVKFARMSQAAGRAEVDRKSIEEIINETHEAIPEPSEEELLKNQEYLEKLAKRKRRKKWILAISGVLALLILAGVVYGSITGFDNLRDKVFGNPLRELAEGQWVKSEYGYPAVVLETPEVLLRVDARTANAPNSAVSARDIFAYGQMRSPLYIMVSTTRFGQNQDIALDTALDAVLDDLEQSGAKNLLVKRDDFETHKGIKGLKAYGEFNLQVSDKEILKEKSSYELLLFAQENGLQEVLIVYQDKNKYSEEIKDRIEASLELEISANNGK